LENLPPRETAPWLDVPWCKADLYFIERLALVLGSAGR
jgi:hypothetical protein